MPQYRALVRRNLPKSFVDSYLGGLPAIYRGAHELAEAHLGNNIPYFRGSLRFGMSEDLAKASADICGLRARHASSGGSMTHVEIYSRECVFVQGKSDEPGSPRSSQFINELSSPNRQVDAFETIEERLDRETTDKRLLVQLTHTPDVEDPSVVAFVTVVIEGPDGVIDHFPLSSLYMDSDDEGGIEIVPDNVVTPPRGGAATGSE